MAITYNGHISLSFCLYQDSDFNKMKKAVKPTDLFY